MYRLSVETIDSLEGTQNTDSLACFFAKSQIDFDAILVTNLTNGTHINFWRQQQLTVRKTWLSVGFSRIYAVLIRCCLNFTHFFFYLRVQNFVYCGNYTEYTVQVINQPYVLFTPDALPVL